MLVEINEISIQADNITLKGTNLESIIMTEDLFAEIRNEQLVFVFDKDKEAHMKYLWKVCESQRRCKGAKSFGEMINLLAGAMINISENFREEEKKAKKK